MDKILAIGRAEFLQAVRSKAFLIGVFMMPVFMGGSLVVSILFKDQVDLDDRVCAVVDPTGELWPVLVEAAERRNGEQIWEQEEDGGERIQRRPRFVLDHFEPEGAQRSDLALSRRVATGDLQGFVMIDASILEPETELDDSRQLIAYHTNEPTYNELPNWIERVVNDEVRKRRYDAADIDQALVARLDRRIPLETWGLVSERSDGTVEEAEEENEGKTFGVPMVGMMLLFMLVMINAQNLMNVVLEEKMQRISEVLVSAVSPFQLMLGKLVGTIATCLSLALIYLGGGYWALHHFGHGDFVPTMAYVWFATMLVFSLLMYGALFSALGSACSELRDAQSMIMPALLLLLIPMFFLGAVMQDPNGSVAQTLTWVPTATPMILLLRLLAQPGPETWEVVLGLLMCLVTTVVLVWASGKIFRVGVLAQGQTPSFRQLLGWVLAK